MTERGLKEGLEKGMKKGIQQGMKQGIQQGMEQGRTDGKKEIIISMLEQGLDVNTIAQYTKINKEFILSCKENK